MTGYLEPIDEHLKKKINVLVAEGVRNVPEMIRHLKRYVSHELFQGRSTFCSRKRQPKILPQQESGSVTYVRSISETTVFLPIHRLGEC